MIIIRKYNSLMIMIRSNLPVLPCKNRASPRVCARVFPLAPRIAIRRAYDPIRRFDFTTLSGPTRTVKSKRNGPFEGWRVSRLSMLHSGSPIWGGPRLETIP